MTKQYLSFVIHSPFWQQIKRSSFLRYSLIGASAFVIDFGLLHLGLSWHLSLLWANGIAATVAIIYSFLLHRYFTFADRAKEEGYLWRGRYQFISFVSVSILAVIFNEFLMIAFVEKNDMHVSLAKILTSAILFGWNYSVNATLTFRAKKMGTK